MEMRKNLADVMQGFMKERNKSAAEFSEELEISRSTLQDYLRGQGNPSVAMLEHLGRKLAVDPLLLITGVFRPEQMRVVLLMFRMVKAVTGLADDRRRQFADLFVQMVNLWDGEIE